MKRMICMALGVLLSAALYAEDSISLFRKYIQEGNTKEAYKVFDSILRTNTPERVKKDLSYELLRKLYAQNKIDQAGRLLERISQGMVNMNLFVHYFSYENNHEKAFRYLEYWINNVGNSDQRQNLVMSRAEYADDDNDRKKWMDMWLQNEIKDSTEEYRSNAMVQYYRVIGDVDNILTEYENHIPHYQNNGFYRLLKDNYDYSGVPLRLYLKSRPLPVDIQIQRFGAIITQFPDSKSVHFLLKEMLNLAGRSYDASIKTECYALVKKLRNRDYGGYFGGFPMAGWGIGEDEIKKGYDKEIGGVKNIDFNKDGKPDSIIAYVLTKKGSLNEGLLSLNAIINDKKYQLYSVLNLQLESHNLANKEFFDDLFPVNVQSITSARDKDIILKVAFHAEGEVGSYNPRYVIMSYDKKSDRFAVMYTQIGSFAGDGGEIWKEMPSFADYDKDGICDMIIEKLFSKAELNEDVFPYDYQEKETSYYKFVNGTFKLDKAIVFKGFADKGDAVYDELFGGQIPGTDMEGNEITLSPQKVRLINSTDELEHFQVELTNGKQTIVPANNLRNVYYAKDRKASISMVDEIVRKDEFRIPKGINQGVSIDEALELALTLKEYDAQNECRQLLSALLLEDMNLDKREKVWSLADNIFDKYVADKEIQIEKSCSQTDIVGKLSGGEEFYCYPNSAYFKMTAMVTRRKSGNIWGAINSAELARLK